MFVKSIFKYLLYFIILFSILLAILFFGANTWLNIKLSKGNIDLSFIKTYAVDILNKNIDFYTIDADKLEMSKTSDGKVLLYFKNVNFSDQTNLVLVEAPIVIIENEIITYALGSISNLFTGNQLKSNVSVIRPMIHINMNEYQSVTSPSNLDLNKDQLEDKNEIIQTVDFDIENEMSVRKHFYQDYFSYLHSLISTKSDNKLNDFWNFFSILSFKDSSIKIKALNKNLSFNNLQIDFIAEDESRNLILNYPMNKTENNLGIEISIGNDINSSLTNIDFVFKNIIPDNLISLKKEKDFNSLYNGALSGRLNMDVNNLGRVIQSTIDLNVSQGEMDISLPFTKNKKLEIEDAYISIDYKSANESFIINELILEQDGYNIKSKGSLGLNYNTYGGVDKIDTKLSNLSIEKDKIFLINESDLDLNINMIDGGLLLKELSGEMLNGKILITNTKKIDHQEFNLSLTNTNALDIKSLIDNIEGLSYAKWFKKNVNEAKINEVLWSFKLLDSGEFLDSYLTMDFENSSFYYFDKHPPIINASGILEIKDEKILLELAQGDVDLSEDRYIKINSINGSIDIKNSNKFADFTLELDSDIDYFLSYLESINFNNFDFLNRKENLKGQANIDTRIQFPIPMESYKDFEIDVDMQIEDGRYLLSEEDSLIIPIVNIDFRNNIIKSNGELNYKGIPSQFTTTTSLDSQLTTQIELSTSVSPTEINILAPYLGEYVGGFGRVPADIIISTSLNDFSPEQAVIKADLTDIILQYSGFNWQKNINDRAELTLIMNKIASDAKLEGNDYNIKFLYDSDSNVLDGYIVVDSGFDGKSLTILNYSSKNTKNLQLDIEQNIDGPADVNLQASSIDISSFIDSDIFMRSNKNIQNILTANLLNANLNIVGIDKVIGKNGEGISSFNGRINLNDGKIQEMDLTGNFNQNENTPIKIIYSGAQESLNSPADLGVTTDDGGAFLRFMGIYNRAQEGYMQLRATGRNINNMSGQMGIEDILVSDDKNLVTIFAESGPNPNRPDIYNVRFKLLKTEFQIEDEIIYVHDMQLFGPSDRLKLKGRSDNVSGRFKFQGDYCADYISNASFGSIPLFGPLLTGGNEDCLSATPVKIERDQSGGNIMLSVNPLGTVAPGIFRDLFNYN